MSKGSENIHVAIYCYYRGLKSGKLTPFLQFFYVILYSTFVHTSLQICFSVMYPNTVESGLGDQKFKTRPEWATYCDSSQRKTKQNKTEKKQQKERKKKMKKGRKRRNLVNSNVNPECE